MIPLTDSSHTLLPLQFAMDPGPEFAWNRDEFDSRVVSSLRMHPNAQVTLLNRFLEIVKVALPDGWQLVNIINLSCSTTIFLSWLVPRIILEMFVVRLTKILWLVHER